MVTNSTKISAKVKNVDVAATAVDGEPIHHLPGKPH
jgi:hypothetical protein